jgi:phosphoglycolate phosphatase
MIENFKAIIFDWDGTLVDTCGLILDAHNHVRRAFGQPEWTMEDFMGRASQSAREYYPQVYGDKADEAQKVLYAYVEEHHLTYMETIDGAEELLTFLNEKGMPVGVVSNKRHSTLHIEIEAVKWMKYFRSTIGAGHALKDKPSPEPLLMAIKAIGEALKPADILYVGDTETDLMCAQNTGCPAIFIQSDKPRPDLINKYKPLASYDSLNGFFEDIKSKMEPRQVLIG